MDGVPGRFDRDSFDVGSDGHSGLEHRALAIKLDYAEALNNRGSVLMDPKRSEEALATTGNAWELRRSATEVFDTAAVGWVAKNFLKALLEALSPWYDVFEQRRLP